MIALSTLLRCFLLLVVGAEEACTFSGYKGYDKEEVATGAFKGYCIPMTYNYQIGLCQGYSGTAKVCAATSKANNAFSAEYYKNSEVMSASSAVMDKTLVKGGTFFNQLALYLVTKACSQIGPNVQVSGNLNSEQLQQGACNFVWRRDQQHPRERSAMGHLSVSRAEQPELLRVQGHPQVAMLIRLRLQTVQSARTGIDRICLTLAAVYDVWERCTRAATTAKSTSPPTGNLSPLFISAPLVLKILLSATPNRMRFSSSAWSRYLRCVEDACEACAGSVCLQLRLQALLQSVDLAVPTWRMPSKVRHDSSLPSSLTSLLQFSRRACLSCIRSSVQRVVVAVTEPRDVRGEQLTVACGG
eukprot:715562-Hanusia_phi.AAC.1